MTVEKPQFQTQRAIGRHRSLRRRLPKNTLALTRYLWVKGVRKFTALDYGLTKVNLTSINLTSRQLSTLLFSGDIAALLCSFQGLLMLHGAIAPQVVRERLPASSALLMMAYVIGLYLSNTYRPRIELSGIPAPTRTLISNLTITVLLTFVVYVSDLWTQGSWINRSVWLGAIALFSLWTSFSRLIAAQWQQHKTRSDSWLLLGFGQEQQSFLTDVQPLNLSQNITVLIENGQQAPTMEAHTTVGQLDHLETWIARTWTKIVVSNHLQLSNRQAALIARAKSRGIPVLAPSDLYENYCAKIPAKTLPDNRITFSTGFRRLSSQVGARIKRLSDIVLASTVLILISPIMLLTAILIKLDTPGPIFYSQTRTGRNMRSFKVHKFRSMVQDAEKHGAQWAQTQDSRITRVGRFIRLVRIDELPQLWNVLRGEMSMIGPRPERPEFDQQLTAEIPHYSVRYMVKPGITGWAQVLYPYGASIEDAYEKLAYDLYYIKNYSPWLDVLIVLKTLRVVLLGKGR